MLNSIKEFRWLSRTELWIEESRTLEDFEFKITETVKDGVLEKSLLKESKVIRAYCDTNLVSTKEAIEEFSRRKEKIEQNRSNKD